MDNFQGFTDEQRREIEANSPLMQLLTQVTQATNLNPSKPGPKTPEGKRRVAMNAIKHGFSGHAVFVPEHQSENYATHIRAFKAEYHPKGYTEEIMVKQLTDISWQLEGIRANGENIMALLGTQAAPFETSSPEQNFMAAQAANFEKHMKEIHLLGVYENRKQRLFNTTLEKLRQVQKERKQQEQRDLAQASLVRRATQAAGEKWNPADDGFVCSLEQIDRLIKLENRLTPPPGGRKKAA